MGGPDLNRERFSSLEVNIGSGSPEVRKGTTTFGGIIRWWALARSDVSDVGFLIAGACACVQRARAGLAAWERAAVLVFAAGLLLTSLGSAWYHWAPGSGTLVWDRLPLSALFPTVRRGDR